MSKLNSGVMPCTDYKYEEFEGLLASLYLTLKPLANGNKADKSDWQEIVTILNGFAERQNVQSPEESIDHPRQTESEWTQPKVFKLCSTIWDMMGSFNRDFGIGWGAGTDFQEISHLCQTILKIFKRHNIAELKYKTVNGKTSPYSIVIGGNPKLFGSFENAIAHQPNSNKPTS